MFLYIYIIICLIKIINAIVVKDGNDFIDNLSKSSNSVTLNIKSKIDITREIKINESIKKLHITGDSLNTATLNLNYPLYFDSKIEEIEIKDININGILFFKKNNKKITLDNVNLNGYIDSDFNYDSDNDVEITKFNYKPMRDSVENCINLSGNIKISRSNFYGSSSCRNRLLHYDGFDKYKFELKDSNFNGENECLFLEIENALKANIETSYFENGYSSRNTDGGYIKK